MKTYDKAVVTRVLAHCIAMTEFYTSLASSKEMPKGGKEEATLKAIRETKKISEAERNNIYSLFEVYFDCKFPREAKGGKLGFKAGTVFVPLNMSDDFPEGELIICCREGDTEFSIKSSKKGFFTRLNMSAPQAKNARYATADEIRELFNIESMHSNNEYLQSMIERIP